MSWRERIVDGLVRGASTLEDLQLARDFATCAAGEVCRARGLSVHAVIALELRAAIVDGRPHGACGQHVYCLGLAFVTRVRLGLPLTDDAAIRRAALVDAEQILDSLEDLADHLKRQLAG